MAYDTVNRDKLFERLNQVGITGLFLKNIESMYQRTKYLVKYKNGYLGALDCNLDRDVRLAPFCLTSILMT